MVLISAASPDRALFMCLNCIDQPKKGYDKAAIQGVKAFKSAFEQLKEQQFEEDSTTDSMTYITSETREDDNQNLPKAKNDVKLEQGSEMDFEPVREERYNGFDGSTVNNLVRQLRQSILDYDIEIRSSIDRFAVHSDVRTQNPLAAWSLVDVNEDVTIGKQWFRKVEADGDQPTYHSPLTSALRQMLGISDGKPLTISSSLKNLTFSQVHVGLISWFVFDILDNKCDLYELPNMGPMAAMMNSVRCAGEASEYDQF